MGSPSAEGTVKLAVDGASQPLDSLTDFAVSRHTSPHTTHGTSAFSTSGGESPAAGDVPHERDSARVRALTRSVARAHVAKERLRSDWARVKVEAPGVQRTCVDRVQVSNAEGPVALHRLADHVTELAR